MQIRLEEKWKIMLVEEWESDRGKKVSVRVEGKERWKGMRNGENMK